MRNAMVPSVEWEVKTTHPDHRNGYAAIHYKGVHEVWARWCYADVESRLVKGATVVLLNGTKIVSTYTRKE